MKEILLDELDDRLSSIKRWAICRTLQTQSVAEHCFNVQRICMRLAVLFHLNEDTHTLFQLSQAALHHDNKESLSGDIPSTAKGYITVGENGVDTDPNMWYTGASDEIKAIVKLADILEAVHFLSLEVKMGNRYLRRHRARLQRALDVHLNKHPEWPEAVRNECHSWMAWVEQSTSATFE